MALTYIKAKKPELSDNWKAKTVHLPEEKLQGRFIITREPDDYHVAIFNMWSRLENNNIFIVGRRIAHRLSPYFPGERAIAFFLRREKTARDIHSIGSVVNHITEVIVDSGEWKYQAAKRLP